MPIKFKGAIATKVSVAAHDPLPDEPPLEAPEKPKIRLKAPTPATAPLPPASGALPASDSPVKSHIRTGGTVPVADFDDVIPAQYLGAVISSPLPEGRARGVAAFTTPKDEHDLHLARAKVGTVVFLPMSKNREGNGIQGMLSEMRSMGLGDFSLTVTGLWRKPKG